MSSQYDPAEEVDLSQFAPPSEDDAFNDDAFDYSLPPAPLGSTPVFPPVPPPLPTPPQLVPIPPAPAGFEDLMPPAPGPGLGALPVQAPPGVLPVTPPPGVLPAAPAYQAPGYQAPDLSGLSHDPNAYDSGAGYVTVGRLSVETLLTGDADHWRHLDEKVLQARTWVQDRLTTEGMSDDIVAARAGDAAARADVITHIDRLLFQYLSKESLVRGADKAILTALVINEVVGLGPIEPLWSDPSITEVMVNGPEAIFIERGGKTMRVPGARFRDAEHVLEVINHILNPLNRRLDPNNPLEDGRLPDGSRVNAVHHAVAPEGPLLTIRRFREVIYTIPDLMEIGSMTEEMACTLAWLIKYKCNAIVAGGTGSGKTTLLNALSCCIPRHERIATIEDSLELRFHPDSHVVAMEARPASASGKGEVTIRRLVKNSLRMRPDRVVVGEVRDAAALDMLTAMNTGHEGSLTTIHANSPEAVVGRLKTMIVQGGDMPASEIEYMIAEAVDVIIYVKRYPDGVRRVESIYEVPVPEDIEGGRLEMRPIWVWEATGEDENGKLVGEYKKINELSEGLRKARRLDLVPMLTMDDVRELSELPEWMQAKANG